MLSPPPQPTPSTVAATVTATPRWPGPVPPNFVGYSVEISNAVAMLTFGGQARPSLQRLFRSCLMQSGPTAPGPNFRIGGNSADESVFEPDPSVPLPPNTRYRITGADLRNYTLVAAWNGTLTLDTTLANASSTAYSQAHVRAIAADIGFATRTAQGLPLVEGIEIGNEPDLFRFNGLRSRNFTVQDYWAQYAMYVANLTTGAQAPMPPGRVQALVFCCGKTDFDSSAAAHLQSLHAAGQLGSVSYHRYPHNIAPITSLPAAIERLLADNSSAGLIDEIQPIIAATTALGRPFYIAEGGVIGKGPGFGDTFPFAVALFALDLFFEAASRGVQRFNTHGGPNTNSWNAAIRYNTSSDQPIVTALFYGQWAFARATANHSRILTTRVESTTNPLIKIHAARSSDTARTTVAIIHKDPYTAAPGNATVRLAVDGVAAGTPARLVRLVSRHGVEAVDGFTFGCQTLDGTQGGEIHGQPCHTTVIPDASDHRYVVSIAPGTIALLEIGA